MQGKNELGDVRIVDLDADSEFRFEVDFKAQVQIKLLKGTAEIFGTELATGVDYTFSGRKAAVYTWHGCALEISFYMIHNTATNDLLDLLSLTFAFPLPTLEEPSM